MEQTIAKQLKKVLAENSGGVLIDELRQVVEALLKMLGEMEKRLQEKMSEGTADTYKVCERMMSDMKDMEGKLSDIKKSQSTDVSQINKTLQSFIAKIEDVKANMPTMPDLSVLEAKIEEIKASIPVIKDTILDTPIQIREKVQSLPEGERWNIEDVNNLRKEIDGLRQELRSIPRGGTTRVLNGRTGSTAFEKLTLNGSDKTFYISNLRDVVAIMGTSFPTVFASVTDYTVGNKSITFTNAIDAATTLASGQTVIVIYNQLHYT